MTATRSLRKARDFDRVYERGRRSRRDGVGVVAAAAEAGGSSRVGLVVSGRVGGAVVRSRVRRRLRAALGVCGIPPGYDVVVWGSRELVGKNFQEIVSHLEGALEGAGVRG